MPKFDNEKSIRLTVRELMFIQEALKDMVHICTNEMTDKDRIQMERQIKIYKDIIFKIDKKLNFSSVTDTEISI